MKLLIASDLHGDLDSAEKLLDAFRREGADRLLLLGDYLYHGPRNGLPPTYAPKKVIELLNANAAHILAIRGNCDSEVDQMVLKFPMMAEYALLSLDGLTVYATHGHKENIDNPPKLAPGDLLLCGHTHIPKFLAFGKENVYLNPGSVSMPKEGNPCTYLVYENRTFTLKTLDGNLISIMNF